MYVFVVKFKILPPWCFSHNPIKSKLVPLTRENHFFENKNTFYRKEDRKIEGGLSAHRLVC